MVHSPNPERSLCVLLLNITGLAPDNLDLMDILTNHSFRFHIDKSSLWTNVGTNPRVDDEVLLCRILGRVEAADKLKPNTFVYLIRKFPQTEGKLGW